MALFVLWAMQDLILTESVQVVDILFHFVYKISVNLFKSLTKSKIPTERICRNFVLWAMQDLNLRPSLCKSAALPTELIAPQWGSRIVPVFRYFSIYWVYPHTHYFSAPKSA